MRADGIDAFLGDFLVRFNISEHRNRVAIAREGFHTEGWVDQGIAARKGVALCSRKNRVFGNGERQLLAYLFQKICRLYRGGFILTFRFMRNADFLG